MTPRLPARIKPDSRGLEPGARGESLNAIVCDSWVPDQVRDDEAKSFNLLEPQVSFMT
ncbi:protein of unknown function [Magnetospirillum sp. XM-1]|nr:protein of unknown function [Magnetospirillum sp. XM-1]